MLAIFLFFPLPLKAFCLCFLIIIVCELLHDERITIILGQCMIAVYIYTFLSVIFCSVFNFKFLNGMFGLAAIATIIFLRDISIILTRVGVLQ